MDRTTGRMNEDLLRLTVVLGRQMDRATGGMNEELLRLTVCGSCRDRWIELQDG